MGILPKSLEALGLDDGPGAGTGLSHPRAIVGYRFDPSVRFADQAVRKELKQEIRTVDPGKTRRPVSAEPAEAVESEPGTVLTQGTVFNPSLVVSRLVSEGGPPRGLDLSGVLAVVRRWRDAVLSHSNELPEQVRGLLSGHNQDGSPIEGPHLAFVPLAVVGHPHADGRLLGMGLAFPGDMSSEDHGLAMRAVDSVRHIAMGRLGRWKVETETRPDPPRGLRPEAWTAHPDGATHWATVTPVVFDRHPKADTDAGYQEQVRAMIATACTRIGLPEPREVIVTDVSAHLGAPPAFEFPRLQRKDGSERRHTHAILVFGEPVCGPVLIGAGRYRGYGACRVLSEMSA